MHLCRPSDARFRSGSKESKLFFFEKKKQKTFGLFGFGLGDTGRRLSVRHLRVLRVFVVEIGVLRKGAPPTACAITAKIFALFGCGLSG
jgi:hypothetical protein